MTSRIGGSLFQPSQSSADRRDLMNIKDKFLTMYSQAGAIGPAQAQAVLNEAMRDGQLTASEASFLAQTFQANAQIFTPEAAQMLNQFLGQYGMNMGPSYLPQPQYQPQYGPTLGQPQGWVPGPGYGMGPEIEGLRQSLGQLFQSGNLISGSDAKMLINRAMSNRDTAPQGVQILAQAFQMNRGAFSPEAGMVINNFLMASQPGMVPGGNYSVPGASGWGSPTYAPTNPYYARAGDMFDNRMGRPVSRSEERQLVNLRNDFVNMLTNDGMVTPNEVQNLLSQALRGQLTQAEVGLVAQGFRDNQNRFTPEAAMMMRQFLGQYGF